MEEKPILGSRHLTFLPSKAWVCELRRRTQWEVLGRVWLSEADLRLAGSQAQQGIYSLVVLSLDTARYKSGIKVGDKALKAVNIKRHSFHGEWNDLIRPNTAVVEVINARP